MCGVCSGDMKKKIAPLIESVSESTAACLFTMVQGNLVALTASHLITASQTGIIAGSVATLGIFLSKVRNRWLVAGTLGVTTAVVDFFVHPGMFGDEATEAIMTGCVAAGLSYAVGSGMQVMRRRRAVR